MCANITPYQSGHIIDRLRCVLAFLITKQQHDMIKLSLGLQIHIKIHIQRLFILHWVSPLSLFHTAKISNNVQRHGLKAMPSLPAHDVMDKGYLASCPVSILSDLGTTSLGIW
jgi:hypothetical protein